MTNDDVSMLEYFWTSKEDLEQWSGFEEAKPRIRESCPELLYHWEKFKLHKKILDNLVGGFEHYERDINQDRSHVQPREL
jgi:hypothetical protein